MPPRADPTSPSRRRSARVVTANSSSLDQAHQEHELDDEVTEVVAAEYGREGQREVVWLAKPSDARPGGAEISRVRAPGHVGSASVTGWFRSARAAFLPEGYPSSVSEARGSTNL